MVRSGSRTTATIRSAGSPRAAASRSSPTRTFAHPKAITAGPDGNLWFTTEFPMTLGRITPAGAITVFTDPALDSFGRRDHHWCRRCFVVRRGARDWARYRVRRLRLFPADRRRERAARDRGRSRRQPLVHEQRQRLDRRDVTPAGTFSNFTHPTIDGPTGITSAPDGNLWFTNEDGDSVGRITPAGVVSNFPIPPTPASSDRSNGIRPTSRSGPTAACGSRSWAPARTRVLGRLRRRTDGAEWRNHRRRRRGLPCTKHHRNTRGPDLVHHDGSSGVRGRGAGPACRVLRHDR